MSQQKKERNKEKDISMRERRKACCRRDKCEVTVRTVDIESGLKTRPTLELDLLS